MGIYTSAGFSGSSVDIYSPAEEELCCEGFDINFYEASMVAVAESEAIYNNSMKEVGIAELRYFEENGQEVIYEAVDVKAIFNKIKMFFKKLIDKVKAIFHTFIAKISSFVQSDKDFVKKYEKEFSRKWNDVKEDFEFKGYVFTIKNEIGEIKDDAESENIDDTEFEIKGKTYKYGEISKMKVAKDINDIVTLIKDNREEIEESLRADIFNVVMDGCCTIAEKVKVTSGLDAKDFSEELYSAFRNQENSKEAIEKKDIVGGVATITSELRSADKTKKAAEKITKEITKNIDKAIKMIDRGTSDILKTIPDKEGKDNEEKNENTNVKSALIALLNEFSSTFLRTSREYYVQASGAFLAALKDRSRQYKAIMVKVISGSKKMQRESYDYTNESYDGSGSFLDSVVLK